jgi:hypothetical protein
MNFADSADASTKLREQGACRCEFASLLLAWLCLLRAQTRIVLVGGVTERLRLDSAGYDPQELCDEVQVGLQVAPVHHLGGNLEAISGVGTERALS